MNIQEFTQWAQQQNIPTTDAVGGYVLGQKVIYTNEYGVPFGPYAIIGFQIPGGHMLPDNVVYLDKDAYWFPVKVSDIKAF